MERQINYQPLAWFWDYFQREMLDMDPPYQRRSVWNQEYKDFFIDTVLNNFPAPAIFLFQDIKSDGRTLYSVVDGKQRLSTIFDFVSNRFPVSDTAILTNARGKYFKDLDEELKKELWRYQFSIEYISSSDEGYINSIFDRINRNVAKLTPQELRHAKFDGCFINAAETMAATLERETAVNFPVIASQSRRQMKDVELVAQLLLMIEEGPKSYTQIDLDAAFSLRDGEWEAEENTTEVFISTVQILKRLIQGDAGQGLTKSRLRNQADFYSLFGAIVEMQSEGKEMNFEATTDNLLQFIEKVEDPGNRTSGSDFANYYEAARSASNDATNRRRRIDILKKQIEYI